MNLQRKDTNTMPLSQDVVVASVIEDLLRALGEDPEREGLQDTPARVAAAWEEMLSGYRQNIDSVLKTFDNDEGYNEMVISRDIPFYSTCEHHLLPFYGVAHVGYLPTKRVIGLSKLARVVDIFARRLQVQERLTQQITNAIQGSSLNPAGVGVVIESTHLCMACRGVKKHDSTMVTSCLLGAFQHTDTRAEFLSLIKL
jgi:GTP cyclohydrolase I